MYGPPFRPEIGKVTLSVVPPVMNMKDPAEVCETVVVMFAFLPFPLMSFHEVLPGVNVAAEYRANRPFIGIAVGLLVTDGTTEGVTEGSFEGDVVGMEVGIHEVGGNVGIPVGPKVGRSVGMDLNNSSSTFVISERDSSLL